MTAPLPDARDGGLTAQRLAFVLDEVCSKAGLHAEGAELLKFTNNAVFRLARAPLVVRIAGSRTVRERVPTVIQVARWLEGHGVPAVRLSQEISQPIEAAGTLATIWHHVPETGRHAGGADLGRMLRTIHALPEPRFKLRKWNPFRAVP